MKRRILVVDDSFYMRTILKNMLSDAGYDVVGEAPNGETALELARKTFPDLVTLDVILPDSTGLEVLKDLKKDFPKLKIVMVSAVGQDAVVDEAMSNGAKAYIVKPFSEEKVLSTIADVFENQEEEA